uniref:Ubiquitin carboxyl-terminal hydrolase MINDY n=1 Tax=Aotus nancymaae TaxID=37293 RepID=A0A2K5DVG0_AOTNA
MSELTKELMELVWGTKSSPGLSDTIFCRWTQGFVFSESEGSALEQFEGGPCAVIAPVQAFLLKKLLFSSEKSSWRDCSEEEQKELLCHTLCDILESACCDHSGPYCLVSWLRGKTTEETASISGSPAEPSCQVEHSCKIYFYFLNYVLFLCFIFFHHPCLLSFLFCLPLFSKLLSLCLLL